MLLVQRLSLLLLEANKMPILVFRDSSTSVWLKWMMIHQLLNSLPRKLSSCLVSKTFVKPVGYITKEFYLSLNKRRRNHLRSIKDSCNPNSKSLSRKSQKLSIRQSSNRAWTRNCSKVSLMTPSKYFHRWVRSQRRSLGFGKG